VKLKINYINNCESHAKDFPEFDNILRMEELIYSIDKGRSSENDTLVINIQIAEKKGFIHYPLENQPVLTQERLLQLSTPKDANILPFLIKEETAYLKKSSGRSIEKNRTPLNYIHVSYLAVLEVMKLFITTGKLYFQGKALTIDIYNKTEFYYVAEGKDVLGYMKTGSQEFTLSSCDCVIRGSPHFFVKGILLRPIMSDISWKDLKASFEGKIRPLPELLQEAEEDNDAPRVLITESDSSPLFKTPEPLPILVLKDRLGAFARLEMRYETESIDYHDQTKHTAITRQLAVEAAWEKDLLETSYIKKMVGTSHYYCPLDKVAKSIAFILEMGWQVKDFQGNTVHLQNNIEIHTETNRDHILIRGKVHYDKFEADLTDIVGAFNRRDRFAVIAPGHVALLPSNIEQFGYDFSADAIEIVGNTFQVKKNQIGALTQLFENNPRVRLDEGLLDLKNKLETFQGINTTLPGSGFLGTLRPYQQEGLNWLRFLHDFSFNGILADDMGLGKTVQLIAFLSTLTLSGPVLIVMPTSLIFNWKKELERFLPSLPCTIYHGSERNMDLARSDKSQIILTTYTTLRLDFAILSQISYECLILDEAQAIKNANTQTSKLVAKLDATFRLSITGTPVENNLMELWSHFHVLMPDLFGEEKAFESEVQAGLSDPRFLRRIQRKCRPFLLRRRKEDVAKDLPEKIEQIVWVEMEEAQRSIYESFLSGIRKNLLTKVSTDGLAKHRMEVLEAIMRLRQICCHPLLVGTHDGEVGESAKLEALVQDLETAISEGRKILVYSQFTSMLALISKRVKEAGWKYVYLDGSTKDREKVVNEFQNNSEISIFLISLKAGGIGLNLTAADYVFLYDPWWNNAVENQAIDRAHRIGRKDTVIAKRYIIAESIEEKILKLKLAKSALASDLFDDAMTISSLSTEDLTFLL